MTEFGQELDAFQVAETYYSLPPATRDYKELVKQLFPRWRDAGFNMKAWENRLGKMVRGLEQKGLIHHTVLRGNTEYLPRKPGLEDEFRRRFALRQAVVVDISSLGLPQGTPTSHGDQWDSYDDKIHKRLGAWGGRMLASCLRPGDVVATGGGRGPHFTVMRCTVGDATRYAGDIVPLTGLITARAWHRDGVREADEPPFVDADNVASELHGKLGSRGRVHWINRSITEECCLPSTDKASVAVVGIGALGGGHRLKRFEELDDVKSVRNLLAEMNRLAEAIEQATGSKVPPFYHPVGDVCNWYFVVDEAGNERAPKQRQDLEKLVKELNSKFVNATPECLAKIAKRGMVLAVAGGPHKATAIGHVLCTHRQGPWITHLVTDHRTAGWILQAKKDSGGRNGEAKIATNSQSAARES
jgi:hypothetical protein